MIHCALYFQRHQQYSDSSQTTRHLNSSIERNSSLIQSPRITSLQSPKMSASACSSPTASVPGSSGGYFGIPTAPGPSAGSPRPLSRSNSYNLRRGNTENRRSLSKLNNYLGGNESIKTPNDSTTSLTSNTLPSAPSTIPNPATAAAPINKLDLQLQLPARTTIPDFTITKAPDHFVLKAPPVMVASKSPPFTPTMPSFSPNLGNMHSSPKFKSANDLHVIKEVESFESFKKLIYGFNQEQEDVIVVDLRSFNQYNTSRVKEALNICVPSTLLKRNSFHLSNIFKTMISSQEKLFHSILLNDKPILKIIFYDNSSTLEQCAFHSYQIMKKFTSDIFNDYATKGIELFLLAKGFNYVVNEDKGKILMDTKKFKQSAPGFPIMTTSSDSNSKGSPSSAASLDHCNISKFTLPSATDPSFSFINSLKKNQIQLNNPEELLSQYTFNPPAKEIQNLPMWLKPYLDNDKGLKKIIENFQKIEISENERIYFSIKARQRSNSTNSATSNRSNVSSPNDYILNGTENGFKNRYPNILPYEHSRVKLIPSPITPNPSQNQLQVHGQSSSFLTVRNAGAVASYNCGDNYFSSPNTCSVSDSNNYIDPRFCNVNSTSTTYDDYINANFITVPQINPELNYIATQAPLPSTIKDFWKVCFNNDVNLIISLTSLTEFGVKKSDIYWENSKNVELLEEVGDFNGVDTLVYRKLKITNRKGISKLINQLQFLKWPDSGVLDQKDILQLIKSKDQFVSKSSSESPILVHCSAGCGRTGVFITIDLLLKTFQKLMNSDNVDDLKSSTFWNTNDDLINFIVEQLRKQRISMVQNLNQFIFCYEVLLRYFANLEL